MSNIETSLVHETEAQRRHARIKLPAKLRLEDKNGAYHSFDLIDLSASGFAVQTSPRTLLEGNHYNGELLFKLNTTEFHLPIKFSVLYWLESEHKAGCELSELGQEEVSILHMFISKYLAGDLTTSSDILTTISRENFTKARKKTEVKPLRGWGKVRAMLATGAATCVGMIALAYIGSNLYKHYFITHAVTALIDIEMETVQAPANGYFELVANSKDPVKAGLPLATITSSVFEYLKNTETETLNFENLQTILPGKLNSLVKSPCDCLIIQTKAKDKAYAQQGDVLFDLVRTDSKPYVTAIFNYTDANNLPIGKEVTLQFPGETRHFNGEIKDLTVDLTSGSGNVVATILPEKTLPLDRIRKPVNVFVKSDSFGFLFDNSAIAQENE